MAGQRLTALERFVLALLWSVPAGTVETAAQSAMAATEPDPGVGPVVTYAQAVASRLVERR